MPRAAARPVRHSPRSARATGSALFRTGDPNFMTSLSRGLSVMGCFSKDHPRMTTAEISRRCGLARAVVSRCLYTLQQLGFVSSEGRLFFLSPKVLRLGYSYLAATPLADAAQPILEKLGSSLHESCSVAVLDCDEVVYIARSAAQRIMSVVLNVGSRLPAYCTGLGRALLAQLGDDEIDGYLSRVELVAHTDRTITSPAALRESLAEVRRRGYSLVDQELEAGLRSLAAPIRSLSGNVVASMNVGVSATRISRQRLERFILPALLNAAEELGSQLPH